MKTLYTRHVIPDESSVIDYLVNLPIRDLLQLVKIVLKQSKQSAHNINTFAYHISRITEPVAEPVVKAVGEPAIKPMVAPVIEPVIAVAEPEIVQRYDPEVEAMLAQLDEDE